MIELRAPDNFHGGLIHPFIFLAGGITGCPDWQAELTKRLLATISPYFTVLNPRRQNWDSNASNEEIRNQIHWEYMGFKLADIVTFWFCKDTLNPIVLFELGAHLNKRIVVGCEPGYARQKDVEFQLHFARPDVRVYLDFCAFGDAIIDSIGKWYRRF